MTNQTIEQAVEESVEEFMSQYAWGKFFTIELEQEVRENLVQTLTEDRTALLTELEESIQTIDFYGWNEQTQSKIKEKVQAHLDELIKSNRLELDNP